MEKEARLGWVPAEPNRQRGHRGDDRPAGSVERVADQVPDRHLVAQRFDGVRDAVVLAEAGDRQLVAERLGHVELVEVRR